MTEDEIKLGTTYARWTAHHTLTPVAIGTTYKEIGGLDCFMPSGEVPVRCVNNFGETEFMSLAWLASWARRVVQPRKTRGERRTRRHFDLEYLQGFVSTSAVGGDLENYLPSREDLMEAAKCPTTTP